MESVPFLLGDPTAHCCTFENFSMFGAEESAKKQKTANREPSDLAVAAAGADVVMAAPNEQPAWLVGFEDRVAVKTAAMMDVRITAIEDAANKTSRDVTALQTIVSAQMAEQTQLRVQMCSIQEALMTQKNESDNMSDRSRTTAGTGRVGDNPYNNNSDNPRAAVDKSIIIIGGWPDNSAAPMMIANAKDMLKNFNRDAGNTWSFEETRCMGQRGKNLQCKLKGTPDRTATQQGYDLCKWMRVQNPKPQAVGFRGESCAMWSVMNQPIESRNLSKAINRAIRCLHLLREKAGIPETTMEQGYPLKVIEGRYKGRTLGALACGTFVAVISESTLTTTWDFPKLKDSIIAATEAEVNQMLSTITPTHGD